MSDKTHFEKNFRVVLNVTVVGAVPLSDITQELIDARMKEALARSGIVNERLTVIGHDLPVGLISQVGLKVEEVVQIPEPIILGRKVGDALVMTDEGKQLLEAWHGETHRDNMVRTLKEAAHLFTGTKPSDDEPPKAA